MTTITALNVRLGMDVSNFSEGANLAKSEVTKVASIMRQSVPPAEKYKQELDLLNRAFSESGKQSRQYADAVEHLKRKHLEAAPAIKKTAQATKEADSATTAMMGSIKGMIAAYLSIQTISKSINLANEIEDSAIAFEVLTGSAQDGALVLEQIRKFDKETPLTFSGLTQAAKTMMSFGVEAKDVEKNLRMLSDVTGGNNDRFKMLALAFSQMSAAGRLMGQDVLQMVNAGFNPLQQISKTTGESLIELKKRMEDGAISSDEVRQAFEDATAEGGMFHGMTERLSQTVSGKMNIALSDMEKKLSEVGKALRPLITSLLDAFMQMKPLLDPIVSLIARIATGLGYMAAVATDVVRTLNNVAQLDFTEVRESTDKFLDDLAKREAEAAEAAAKQIDNEFEQKNNAVVEAAKAEKNAARKVAAEKLKDIENEKKAQQLTLLDVADASRDAYIESIKDRRTADQKALLEAALAAEDAYRKSVEEEKNADEKAMKRRMDNIEKERKARLKAVEDEQKEQDKLAQKQEEAFQKELEEARKDAMKFFEDKKKENDKRRTEVAKGPGTGMEVRSAEAVKFAADAVNARIAGAAVPNDPAATNREIAAKTVELLQAQREANAKQERQIQLAEKQLKEMEANGFRRIR